MLQNARPFGGPFPSDGGYGAANDELIDFDRVFAMIRRQWLLVAVFCVVGLSLGLAYVATAVPLYTAYSNLLIDKSSNRIVNELSLSTENTATYTDEVGILSQVELLKSDKLAMDVVKKLKLTDNEAFMTPPESVLRMVRRFVIDILDVSSWFTAAEEEGAERTRRAVEILRGNLEVSRIGGTSVLAVGYTNPDPAEAARIAQAFADAYLDDQLDARYEATRRAGGWLQGRIEELRQRSLASDLAVQKFRADNGLITADGRLVTDQQLSDLNSQLTTAQSEVSTTKARYDRIAALVDSGDANAVVTGSIDNSIISTLRTKYLDADKREGEIAARLGSSHQQAVRLRAEMEEYRRLMFSELGRLAQSYYSDYQIALSREAAAQARVKTATSVTAGANELQVQLRELEREADTYRSLYQTFLQRYQEAIQQQSFPISEARVISRAYPPDRPSKPRKTLVMALALLFGGALGSGLATLREFRDRFYRTGEQAREDLGVEVLGLVPHVRSNAKVRQTVGSLREAVEQRRLVHSKRLTRFVLDHPLSAFTETFRSAKIAADLKVEHGRAKVIGIVSAAPAEGKSTIAINFAELLASQGASTLLVDADLRNPGLTRALAPQAEGGLVECLADGATVDSLIYTDPETGLSFLPASLRRRPVHTSELLTSPRMAALLEDASARHDYVVIDLAPLGPIVDVRAIAPRVDGFIFVIEWGATDRKLVRAVLRNNPGVAEKCIGTVLNNVDSGKMRLYQDSETPLTRQAWGKYYFENT